MSISKGKFWWMTDAGIQVFYPVHQWPYLDLTDRVFLTSVAIPQSHRPGFFLSLFRCWVSVTIPRTWSVRLWYGHWRPRLKYFKKPVWQIVVWPLWLKKKTKKNGLTDQGVATGVTKFRMASGGLRKYHQFSGLVHTCRQNGELVSKHKALWLFINKLGTNRSFCHYL